MSANPDFMAFGDLDLYWASNHTDAMRDLGDLRPNLGCIGKPVTVSHPYGNITLLISSIEIGNGGRTIVIRFLGSGVFMQDGVRSTIDSVWLDLSCRGKLHFILEGDKDVGADRHFRIPATLWKVD